MTEHDQTAFTPEPATLYAVATPIGHLRDITLRALDVLKTVDFIAAEDTRVSSGMLRRYAIDAKLIALHEHNEKRESRRITDLLGQGRSGALISDAGTPGLSDPGSVLIAAVRAAGHNVVPIPGASALAAILSVTGWDATPFTFIGFLPARAGPRRSALRAMQESRPAMVFYEAPHRIVEMLDDLVAVFGGERKITLGREMTKRFESIHESTLGETVEWTKDDSDRQRGEFALVVEGAPKKDDAALSESEVRMLARLLEELPASRAARVAADLAGKSRGKFYDRALVMAGRTDAPYAGAGEEGNGEDA